MKQATEQLDLFGVDCVSGFERDLDDHNANISRSNSVALASVQGLAYVPEFIDIGIEREIILRLDSSIWSDELSRRVQHYGYKYDYKARRIDSGMYVGELPDWMQELGQRLYLNRYIDAVPDQVIVNEYQPGQGITPHVDCEPCFGNTVVSLSLLSSCVMDFTKVGGMETQSVLLDPRSIVVLRGESRYGWKHGIAKRLSDNVNGHMSKRGRRISLTFRNVILVRDSVASSMKISEPVCNLLPR